MPNCLVSYSLKLIYIQKYTSKNFTSQFIYLPYRSVKKSNNQDVYLHAQDEYESRQQVGSNSLECKNIRFKSQLYIIHYLQWLPYLKVDMSFSPQAGVVMSANFMQWRYQRDVNHYYLTDIKYRSIERLCPYSQFLQILSKLTVIRLKSNIMHLILII